jgi:hypothetical protein
VGILAGFGMQMGAKEHASPLSGAIVAIVALASIAGGKYAVVSAIADTAMAELKKEAVFEVTEQDAKMYMASGLIEEAEAAGKKLKWPTGSEPEEGVESEKDLPPEIWKDVQARWRAMDATAQSQYVASVKAQTEHMAEQLSSAIREEGFLQSFGLLDIVFALLAIGTAFTLGAGGSLGGGGE